ncbi:MAG: SelB C-terminal domain-containing protein, partial [Calditrichia bacterium]
LDAAAAPFRRKQQEAVLNQLAGLESANPEKVVRSPFSPAAVRPLSLKLLRAKTRLPERQLRSLMEKLLKENQIFSVQAGQEPQYYSENQVQQVLYSVKQILEKFHRQYPGRLGLKRQEITGRISRHFPENIIEPAIEYGLNKGELSRQGEMIAHPQFKTSLTARQEKLLKSVEALYREAAFQPPASKEVAADLNIPEKEFRELLNILREQEILVWVDERFFFHREAMEKIVGLVQDYFSNKQEMSIAQFKELTGTSRRHAIPLLTYLDNRGVTRREGDVRLFAG